MAIEFRTLEIRIFWESKMSVRNLHKKAVLKRALFFAALLLAVFFQSTFAIDAVITQIQGILCPIFTFVSGPVLFIIGSIVLILAIFGVMMARARELGSAIWVIVGIALAFAVPSIVVGLGVANPC